MWSVPRKFSASLTTGSLKNFRRRPQNTTLRPHRYRKVSHPMMKITTETTLLTIRNMTLPPEEISCPENKMSKIGRYQVPSQHDLVQLTRDVLYKSFNRYLQKFMLFVNQIKEATIAAKEAEEKCHDKTMMYRKCVEQMKQKSETIIKSCSTSLKLQRLDVVTFGQNKACSLDAMPGDPIKLVKTLAIEEALLKFALPSFLRLIDTCTSYCNRNETAIKFKPSRYKMDIHFILGKLQETPNHYKRLTKLKPTKLKSTKKNAISKKSNVTKSTS